MRWYRRNSFTKAVVLFNRNALLFVPLVGGTFCIMAGWIGTSYGTQYLFRDNQPLEFGSAWEQLLPLARSTRVFSGLRYFKWVA